jgi:hypothetical protein
MCILEAAKRATRSRYYWHMTRINWTIGRRVHVAKHQLAFLLDFIRRAMAIAPSQANVTCRMKSPSLSKTNFKAGTRRLMKDAAAKTIDSNFLMLLFHLSTGRRSR